MIGFALALLLLCALGYLGYRHQKLLVRCALAEEKIKNQDELRESFRIVSAEALEKTNQSLFESQQKDLEEKQKAIGLMVDKIHAQMRLLENERKSDHGAMKQQLHALMDAEHQLKSETTRLVKALRSPAGRGRWGEIQLERILEFVGMEQGVDYSCQTTSQGGRPDVVVHLPGGKNVVIDSKAPFDAFERAANASSDEERTAALGEFARRVRQHVQELGRKGYWAHVTPSPDFTFMFLPGDAYLAAAEEQDAELFGYAYERGVLITTPRTIVVMLRTIRVAWQNENASEHAATVLKVASELHDRLSTMADHLAKVGRGLDSAVSAYNKAVGSYGSRVLVSARRLEGLAPTRSPLDDLAPLTEHASSQLQPLQLEVVPKDADAA